MTKSREGHPCLSCTLPDCDETSSGCALKIAMSRYAKARRAGAITEELRRANSIAWQELYAPARHERRQAQRAQARQAGAA